jgi:hypothetical protein
LSLRARKSLYQLHLELKHFQQPPISSTMSDSYASDSRPSNTTLPQNPGLKDDAVQSGTDALNRAEDREVGLSSNPGITNQATTALHQGMDQATGEQTPSTGATADRVAATSEEKGAGVKVKEAVSGVVEKINENVKYK